MDEVGYRRLPTQLHSRARLVISSWVFHLFVSGVIILVVFLHPPNLFFGDTDTARNYLNTIVSSLSTILALCISIILVAIQLTASNYTHRVLDFFVRLPYNASLFTFYLVTIMHSFFLMARIRDPVNDPLPRPLRPEMSADLVLVIICFVSLILYMYAVVQLLKPERIIGLILRDFGRAYRHHRWRSALENVEQICDIAKRAASVNDSVTGQRCTEAMLYTAITLPVPAGSDDPLLAIHRSVVEQWVEIVGVAVKERETGLLHGALDALYRQGEDYILARSWPAAQLVVQAYRDTVFSHLLGEGQTHYIEQVAHRLYELSMQAARADDRGAQFCLRTWEVIETVGESVFHAQPATAGTLLRGFLMPRELVDTIQALPKDRLWTALASYFALWKAFVPVASVQDAARIAHWWAGNLTALDDALSAKLLAVLVALHAGREDVAQTLCYGLGLDPGTVDLRQLQTRTLRNSRLFDGWPLPSLRALKQLRHL